jgi:collagen triple helix repeat protein
MFARRLLRGRALAIALPAAIVTVGVSVVAVAAIPGSDGKISGCYEKNLGILRVIDAQAGKTCTRFETPIAWNQTGPKGDTGATGATGAKGDTGAAGADGAPGAKGDKGDTGATGADGAPGAKGDTGAAGADGAPGEKGDTGATGANGATGPQGTAGPAGATNIIVRQSATGTVSCLPGEKVTGGGGDTLAIPVPPGASTLVWSRPVTNAAGTAATGWTAFSNRGGPIGPAAVTYVLCAAP